MPDADPAALASTGEVREREGTAYCAKCIAAARIKATAKAISLVLATIEHRRPFALQHGVNHLRASS